MIGYHLQDILYMVDVTPVIDVPSAVDVSLFTDIYWIISRTHFILLYLVAVSHVSEEALVNHHSHSSIYWTTLALYSNLLKQK